MYGEYSAQHVNRLIDYHESPGPGAFAVSAYTYESRPLPHPAGGLWMSSTRHGGAGPKTGRNATDRRSSGGSPWFESGSRVQRRGALTERSPRLGVRGSRPNRSSPGPVPT